MLKSMGEAHIRTPTPPKPLNRFRSHVTCITMSPQGVDVQNLVGIDSAVTDLRMREKTYLSICLSVRCCVGATSYMPQFWGDFYAQWLKRRDFATISAFWWSH